MRRLVTLVIALSLALQIHSQEASKKVGLFWDTSYSMIQKDLKKEIQFLSNYFTENSNVEVYLTKFSNDVILTRKYTIEKGNWEYLKNELLNTIYDGSSAYKNIKVGTNDEILLFTDGKESLDKLGLVALLEVG